MLHETESYLELELPLPTVWIVNVTTLEKRANIKKSYLLQSRDKLFTQIYVYSDYLSP